MTFRSIFLIKNYQGIYNILRLQMISDVYFVDESPEVLFGQ